MSAPIVLIDDDVSLSENVVEYLTLAGILNPLITHTNPTAALDYLLNTANPLPIIVLLDLYFPGQELSGIDVLKLIRMNVRTHQLCVFILTATLEQESVAMILGANKFMRKPVDLGALITAVSECGVTFELRESK